MQRPPIHEAATTRALVAVGAFLPPHLRRATVLGELPAGARFRLNPKARTVYQVRRQHNYQAHDAGHPYYFRNWFRQLVEMEVEAWTAGRWTAGNTRVRWFSRATPVYVDPSPTRI